MESDHLVRSEDDVADDLVRRGRHAGSGWIIASGLALAFAMGIWSLVVNVAALTTSAVLLALGLRSRRRYWDDAKRQVGDATIQRARWRTVENNRAPSPPR